MAAFKLRDCVQTLMLHRGLALYFNWNFGTPVKIWWYQNVSKKKWCVQHGWFCNDLNCEYVHLDKPWEEPKIDLKSKCNYCGEEHATTTIPNPNGIDMIQPFWKVCKGCDELIEAQSNYSMGVHITHTMMKYGASDEIINSMEDKIVKSKKKIEEVEKKTGKKGVTYHIRTDVESGFEARKILEAVRR